MNLTVKDSATLCASLVPWSNGVAAYIKAPFVTPLRTIVIGDKPGDLVTSLFNVESQRTLQIKDTSWIKPENTWVYGGKCIWAKEHGIMVPNIAQLMPIQRNI